MDISWIPAAISACFTTRFSKATQRKIKTALKRTWIPAILLVIAVAGWWFWPRDTHARHLEKAETAVSDRVEGLYSALAISETDAQVVHAFRFFLAPSTDVDPVLRDGTPLTWLVELKQAAAPDKRAKAENALRALEQVKLQIDIQQGPNGGVIGATDGKQSLSPLRRTFEQIKPLLMQIRRV